MTTKTPGRKSTDELDRIMGRVLDILREENCCFIDAFYALIHLAVCFAVWNNMPLSIVQKAVAIDHEELTEKKRRGPPTAEVSS